MGFERRFDVQRLRSERRQKRGATLPARRAPPRVSGIGTALCEVALTETEVTDIVYILIDQLMPGLVKIGRTDGDTVEARMKQLYSTASPASHLSASMPLKLPMPLVSSEPSTLRSATTSRQNREFFRLSPDKPKAIFQLLEIRNVTPKIDVVGEPGDQEALDKAKTKAPPFQFSMIGLKPDTELQSVFDEAITCIVKDNKDVVFRGEVVSLSAAALKVAHEKGYTWTKIGGPDYWKYNGRL